MTVLTALLLALFAPLLGLEPTPTDHGVWPLLPRPAVREGFDPPDAPWGPGHRGVDLVGHPGQPVRSALPGVVVFAAPLAGRGVVVVQHGARRTTYEPVEPAVGVGDLVGAGERIGTLQLHGSHCLPAACLHWGLIRGTTYLDPLTLVGAGPVRLLPLGGWVASGAGLRPGGGPAGRPDAAGPW